MAVDYSLHLMLDDIDVSIISPYAAEADAFAGYVTGRWPDYNQLVAKYGKSGKKLLSIVPTANAGLGAECLDVETGDATIASAPIWTKVTKEAGQKAKDGRYYPKLYASIDNGADLIAALAHAGIKRDEFMYWSAHYTDEAHICGPKTCGAAVQADATQWTAHYKGVSLDASQYHGYFFSGAPKHPLHKPVPKHKTGPARHSASGTESLDQWLARAKLSMSSTIQQSAASLADKNLRHFTKYLADGTSSKMPKGLVFWTVR